MNNPCLTSNVVNSPDKQTTFMSNQFNKATNLTSYKATVEIRGYSLLIELVKFMDLSIYRISNKND